MSDTKAQAAAAPRCPLGFSGTPPEGHPSIPEFSDSTSRSSSGPGSGSRPSPATSKLTIFLALIPKSADPRKWTTHQVFFVEVVFLLLCVVLAVYMPRIKSATGARAKVQAQGQSASVKGKRE